jgi:hypothetical protein
MEAGAEGQQQENNNVSNTISAVGGDEKVSSSAGNAKHRRASSTLSEREDQDERRKRQHKDQEMSSAEAKKLSYFQMARLGYQELVNAIIRPPRADYKVRNIQCEPGRNSIMMETEANSHPFILPKFS